MIPLLVAHAGDPSTAPAPEEAVALLLSPRKAVRGRGLELVAKHGDVFARRVLREMTRRAHDPAAFLAELAERRAKAEGEQAARLDRMLAAMRRSDRKVTVRLSVYSVPHKKAQALPAGARELAAWEEHAEARLFRQSVTAADGLWARTAVDVSVSFISDIDVQVQGNTTIADPVVGVAREHGVVRCRPVVSADGRFVTVEVAVRHKGTRRPMRVAAGGLPNTKVQVPEWEDRAIRRTLTMPNGGRMAWRVKREGDRTLVVVAQASVR